MRKTITISVDVENFLAFRESVGNVSRALDQYMAHFSGGSVDQEEEILIQKIGILESKAEELRTLKDQLRIIKQEKERLRLEQIDRQIKDQKTATLCFYCKGDTTPDERVKYKAKNGYFCKACFMSGRLKVDKEGGLI